MGRKSPTNAPLALRKLLQLWRTNSANAYSLTVSNGSGSGNWGAGSILALTANAASPGTSFSHWTGPGISNAALTTTSFIMPGANTTVAAVFTNLPPQQILLTTPGTLVGGAFNLSAVGVPGQTYTVLGNTNLNNTNGWTVIGNVLAAPNGAVSFSTNATAPQQYFQLRYP